MVAARTIHEAYGLETSSVLSDPLVITILMSVMKSSAGIVPKELWGLSRSLDLVAPRGFAISDNSFECYCKRSTEAGRYSIVSLRTQDTFNQPIVIYPGIRNVVFGESFNYSVDFPVGVETLKFGEAFNHPITLPAGLKELTFDVDMSDFDHLLVLPNTLRRLTLGDGYSKPIELSKELEYVKFGLGFTEELNLPSALKVLDMSYAVYFDHPLRLPEHLEELHLSRDFNCPITFPNSLHTVSVGHGFRDSIIFGTGLRSLRWLCNHPVSLPNHLIKVVFANGFQQRVDFPAGLQEIRFCGRYSLPLVLPSSLKRIHFIMEYPLPLALPPGCVRT